MKIANEILENIINQVNISTVIKHYIPVQRKGRNHWATCPFHDDTNPSMSVSDEKKIFKCFVCGEGGNIFSFVKAYENCSFIESVKKVCELSGLDIPEIQNLSINQQKIDPDILLIWEINEEANNYFKFLLNTEEGELALNYLTKRGIKQEHIDEFDIGLSSKNSKIIEFLESKGYSQADLYKAGLISESEGRIYPNFKDRITFAIRDDNNKIIGFSARSINEEVKPKYINSPETKAFIKGNFLYNFFNAKKSVRLKKKIIIVEGFMDTIALHKADIKNSVATMGTAFTKKHCNLIRGITNELIIFMDRDEAGIKATLSILKMTADENFKIRICEGVDGLDADNIINRYGTGKLIEVLNNAVTRTQFLINILPIYYDLNTVQGKSSFMKKMIPEISMISDAFTRDQYIKLIAEKINSNFIDISHYFTHPSKPKILNKSSSNKIFIQNSKEENLLKEEKILLQSMLHNPESVLLYKKFLNDLITKKYKIIATILVSQVLKKDDVNIALLIAELENNDIDPEVIKMTNDLVNTDRRSTYSEQSVMDAINLIINKRKKEKLKAINDKINKLTDPDSIIQWIKMKEKIRG